MTTKKIEKYLLESFKVDQNKSRDKRGGRDSSKNAGELSVCVHKS